MSGFIDFAGQIDTPADWVICGWSDRIQSLRWQNSSASITLRGTRAKIPAQVCPFQRNDIDSGGGLLVRFDLVRRHLPGDAWASLGNIELSCDGERLRLARAHGASVLPKHELKRRLRDVLPHAAASELRRHLLRFAFDSVARDDATSDTLKFISQLIERRSPLLNLRWLATRYGIPSVVLEDDRLTATILRTLGDEADFTTTPLFDPVWYRQQIADAAAPSGYFALLRHYVSVGEAYGLSPNAFFPIGSYAGAFDTDSAAANGTNLLEQFLRGSVSAEQTRHLLFDWHRYHLQTAEPASMAEAELDRFSHYVAFGHRESRQPNPLFDEQWYVANHPEVLPLIEHGAYPNGFSHFVHHGERQNLAPNEFFRPDEYLQLNHDVRDAVAAGTCRSAFWHYWSNGWSEHRPTACDPVAGNVLMHFSMDVPWMDATAMQAIRACAAGNAQPADRDIVEAAVRRVAEPLITVRECEAPVLYAGEAGNVHVGGVALLAGATLVAVTALFNGEILEGDCFRLPRADTLHKALFPLFAGQPLDLGFFASFRLDATDVLPGLHPLRLSLQFSGGDLVRQFDAAELQIRVAEPIERSALQATTQVCMATFRPSSRDLERQIGSILEQRPDPPDIVISDDATPLAERTIVTRTLGRGDKVTLRTNETNLEFVANFERAIRGHSAAAERILLSDQDDMWEPDKVARLREALDRTGGVCAFSDMSVVDSGMNVISPTFWSDRKMHCSSPVALAVANAVTGAASIMHAGFADRLVPFPQFVGLFHDQWLSVAAAACGPIGYVGRPLYRYVQHDGNVLGFAGSRQSDTLLWRTAARMLAHLRHRPPVEWTDRQCDLFVMAMRQCNGNLMQRFVLLREALTRFAVWSDEAERQFAADLCGLITGRTLAEPSRLLWSWRAMRRKAGGDAALLGIDYALKAGLAALVLVRNPGSDLGARLAERFTKQISAARVFQARASDPRMTPLERKIAPVPLDIRRRAHGRLRINLLLPELRQEVFFGGYYAKLALAQRLRECGIATRILVLDQAELDQDQILRIANEHPALADALISGEMIAVGNRSELTEFTRQDAVVATTWWSAHVANDMRERLGQGRFLYLIQEFEPLTFPFGTWYRAAEMTYDFPHVPLFSTAFMRDYFKSAGCGVYAGGKARPRAGENYLVFDNPIVADGKVTPGQAAQRRNILLFYARNQQHAARNMYDFGISALRLVAKRLGRSSADWEFVGLGSDAPATIELVPGVTLTLRSKTSHAEYLRTLHQAKVGLALIYTPHPSLVTLEMAAAGLRTITNACLTKGPDSFKAISENITVAGPDAASLADALLSAMRATQRANWRPRGDVRWPTTPVEAFPNDWIARFARLAEASLRPAK